MENHEHGPPSGIQANETRIEAAAATRIGRRRTNADAFLIDDAAGFYAVADGMGDTPISGAIARKALEVAQQMFGAHWASLPLAERTPEQAKTRIMQGIWQADWRVHTPYLPRSKRIGTTFAGVVACGGAICAAHVGDSRVYLLRRSTAHLAQLTADHTSLGEARRRGMPEDIALLSPHAHKLTRVLGVKPGEEVEPIVRRWEAGDIALLCTDGVSDRVKAEVMEDILLDACDIRDAAQRIVDHADSAGGYDNATVVLVRRVS
jgi:serine/threonine protein phosphatase PrpC